MSRLLKLADRFESILKKSQEYQYSENPILSSLKKAGYIGGAKEKQLTAVIKSKRTGIDAPLRIDIGADADRNPVFELMYLTGSDREREETDENLKRFKVTTQAILNKEAPRIKALWSRLPNTYKLAEFEAKTFPMSPTRWLEV